jgi:hypothetical protein
MNYEEKYYKYKAKYIQLKNKYEMMKDNEPNKLGGKCTKTHQDKLNDKCYIENPETDPTLEKYFNFVHKTPKCSFSIWNKDKKKSYVPIDPTENDLLFNNKKYYFRAYHQKNCSKNVSVVIWAENKHKKWYTIEDFPNDDDNTLLNIANEFGINMDDIIKLEKCIILWLILSNKIGYRIISHEEMLNYPAGTKQESLIKILLLEKIDINKITNSHILSELEKYPIVNIIDKTYIDNIRKNFFNIDEKHTNLHKNYTQFKSFSGKIPHGNFIEPLKVKTKFEDIISNKLCKFKIGQKVKTKTFLEAKILKQLECYDPENENNKYNIEFMNKVYNRDEYQKNLN